MCSSQWLSKEYHFYLTNSGCSAYVRFSNNNFPFPCFLSTNWLTDCYFSTLLPDCCLWDATNINSVKDRVRRWGPGGQGRGIMEKSKWHSPIFPCKSGNSSIRIPLLSTASHDFCFSRLKTGFKTIKAGRSSSWETRASSKGSDW
jgi:hypothetical protein